jgi:DNA-binding CsgD family transcriptional regulator
MGGAVGGWQRERERERERERLLSRSKGFYSSIDIAWMTHNTLKVENHN